MTCRTARFTPRYTLIETVSCCKCRSADRELILKSQTFGPHLCPICAQAKVLEAFVSELLHGLVSPDPTVAKTKA